MSYKPLKSFKDRKERAQYVHNELAKAGYMPLEEYTESRVAIPVLIQTGEYKGYKSKIMWGNFCKGKRPDFRGLSEKEKFLRDKFEEEGYKVVGIPDDVRVVDKIDLVSPEGNEWSVSYDTFRTGVRCPLDSDRSWGERCISTILKENNIPFKAQKTIFHPDGTRQYMDFYVEDNGLKFDIEYHGRQHYEVDVKNRLFLKYEDQTASDKKKRDYCLANDIICVEIPYTVNTPSFMAEYLYTCFSQIDREKKYKVESYRYNEKAVLAFYKTHTEAQTAEEFGISGSTVKNIVRRHGFYKNKTQNGGS